MQQVSGVHKNAVSFKCTFVLNSLKHCMRDCGREKADWPCIEYCEIYKVPDSRGSPGPLFVPTYEIRQENTLLEHSCTITCKHNYKSYISLIYKNDCDSCLTVTNFYTAQLK